MHLLVPIDGSESSFAALEHATQLAAAFDADLTVLHITEYEDSVADSLRTRTAELLEAAGVDGDLVIDTHSGLENLKVSKRIGGIILDHVEDGGYDHVVMGRHGSGRLEKVLLGSCSQAVVEGATVPVTVIP